MAAFKHLAEYPVGVIAALVGALGVLVIDPREHDHLAGRVIAEEQPVLLEELRPEPMLVIVAKGVALAVFRPRGVLRNDVERQLGNRRQPLAGVLLQVPLSTSKVAGWRCPSDQASVRENGGMWQNGNCNLTRGRWFRNWLWVRFRSPPPKIPERGFFGTPVLFAQPVAGRRLETLSDVLP